MMTSPEVNQSSHMSLLLVLPVIASRASVSFFSVSGAHRDRVAEFVREHGRIFASTGDSAGVEANGKSVAR
jgi:hypothetical protein